MPKLSSFVANPKGFNPLPKSPPTGPGGGDPKLKTAKLISLRPAWLV